MNLVNRLKIFSNSYHFRTNLHSGYQGESFKTSGNVQSF